MPEYLKNLRAVVGNLPIVVCGASVIVVNEAGEILLQQRKDNGKWGYPGGIVDVNENTEEAAQREVYEEAGITANSLELFGVFSGKDYYHVYPNGHAVSVVDVVYICKDFSGEPKHDGVESIAARFFAVDDFPQNLSVLCEKVLRKYCAER